jgi:hypothetical protein
VEHNAVRALFATDTASLLLDACRISKGTKRYPLSRPIKVDTDFDAG